MLVRMFPNIFLQTVNGMVPSFSAPVSGDGSPLVGAAELRWPRHGLFYRIDGVSSGGGSAGGGISQSSITSQFCAVLLRQL